MKTACLISCVRQKQLWATAARDLYISELFRKARRFAESSGFSWFILSAEYGLVEPDRVIEPYDCTLKNMGVIGRRNWASRVARQLETAAPELTNVIFLAGKSYREFLSVHLAGKGVNITVPMEGLRIGEQLRWLSQHSPES